MHTEYTLNQVPLRYTSTPLPHSFYVTAAVTGYFSDERFYMEKHDKLLDHYCTVVVLACEAESCCVLDAYELLEDPPDTFFYNLLIISQPPNLSCEPLEASQCICTLVIEFLYIVMLLLLLK